MEEGKNVPVSTFIPCDKQVEAWLIKEAGEEFKHLKEIYSNNNKNENGELIVTLNLLVSYADVEPNSDYNAVAVVWQFIKVEELQTCGKN